MGQPVAPMIDSRGLPNPWRDRQVESTASSETRCAPAAAPPGVMGPPGNGGCDLLRVLADLLRPAATSVELDGPAWLRLDAGDAELVRRLMEHARAGGLRLTGDGGLLHQLGERVLESASRREFTARPVHVTGDPMDHHDGVDSRAGLPPTVYPMIFVDAIHVKFHDGAGTDRPMYVALAVTAEDTRDIIGLWAGPSYSTI